MLLYNALFCGCDSGDTAPTKEPIDRYRTANAMHGAKMGKWVGGVGGTDLGTGGCAFSPA